MGPNFSMDRLGCLVPFSDCPMVGSSSLEFVDLGEFTAWLSSSGFGRRCGHCVQVLFGRPVMLFTRSQGLIGP